MMRICVMLLLTAALAGCSYPTRNQPMTAAGEQHPYTWPTMNAAAPDDMPDTLVVVTASGGGTRATALAMSVFDTLGHAKLPSGKSLADEVDVVSSVSGGSVAAAYFALHGAAGMPALEHDFVRTDGIGALLAAGLNPIGLAALATPSKERIDLLIDRLDGTLFHGATFADLAAAQRRPYLILNAGDMVEGVPFPFTQYTLDLLCSDLKQMKMSTAVAASAAFPVALSPVTLTNYSPCTAVKRPGWIDEGLATQWQINPTRLDQARVADAYFTGRKKYIHLLDGGISDNLGVAEPFRLLTNNDVSPLFLQQIGSGRIKRIVFVMVNARSFPVSALDQQKATPSELSMLLATIDSTIDRATLGTSERVRKLLVEELGLDAKEAADLGLPQVAANLNAAADNTTFIDVDFDAIPLASCRQRFHDIPTSWTLSGPQIDGIEAMGEALLGADPGFQPLLQSLGGHMERPLVSIDQACQVYPAM
ncbi:MAG TPA: patatin-like phospholipase family protein [Candidatus Cybelea sp.]|nr:patatin-like phospholipase family protein [Candidatus Cybelea sp.]